MLWQPQFCEFTFHCYIHIYKKPIQQGLEASHSTSGIHAPGRSGTTNPVFQQSEGKHALKQAAAVNFTDKTIINLNETSCSLLSPPISLPPHLPPSPLSLTHTRARARAHAHTHTHTNTHTHTVTYAQRKWKLQQSLVCTCTIQSVLWLPLCNTMKSIIWFFYKNV
jgi:hypothetical protein